MPFSFSFDETFSIDFLLPAEEFLLLFKLLDFLKSFNFIIKLMILENFKNDKIWIFVKYHFLLKI